MEALGKELGKEREMEGAVMDKEEMAYENAVSTLNRAMAGKTHSFGDPALRAEAHEIQDQMVAGRLLPFDMDDMAGAAASV